MPFTPPKADAYRRFVILDAPSIMAALSAEDGGAVDEILTRRVGESGGELGGEIGHPGIASAKAKRGKSNKIEEELRRVRTEHSAASALIDRLRAKDAIGSLEGSLDEGVVTQLRPGMLVQLSAQVSPHPMFQLESVIETFIDVAPKLGRAEDAKAARGLLPMIKALTGATDASGRVLFDLNTGAEQVVRLLAFSPRSTLQVPLRDITGKFTALGQVEEILTGEDDELAMLRLVRGAKPSASERAGILTTSLSLTEAASELGVDITNEDLIMPSPLVTFRPLCIWR